MDAKELRIGNFVDRNDDDNKLDKTTKVQYYNISDASDFSPISLSEEWVVKFGFIKQPHDNVFFKGRYELEPLSDGSDGWEFCIEHIQEAPPFQYVHQLQNLYFQLTNEDLIIEP